MCGCVYGCERVCVCYRLLLCSTRLWYIDYVHVSMCVCVRMCILWVRRTHCDNNNKKTPKDKQTILWFRVPKSQTANIERPFLKENHLNSPSNPRIIVFYWCNQNNSLTTRVLWRCSPKTATCAKDLFESFGFFASSNLFLFLFFFALLCESSRSEMASKQKRNKYKRKHTHTRRVYYARLFVCMHTCVYRLYTFICGLVVQTNKLKTQLIVDRDVCERLCIKVSMCVLIQYIFSFRSLLLLSFILLSSIELCGACMSACVCQAAWHSFRQNHRFPLEFRPIS